MTSKEKEKRYFEFLTKHLGGLVGRKITGIAASPDEYMGFVLDDGTTVWACADPEDNGPGFLSVDKADKEGN
jgi:hypothetical protein